MKHSLAILLVLTMAAVSCGKKDSGGGSSSSSPLSSSACESTTNYNIEYAERTAIINWYTGEIKIGSKTYSPNEISPNSPNVISQAFASKSSSITSRNNAQGQILYRVTIRAAMVRNTQAGINQLYGGTMYGSTGTTSSSGCVLDLQTVKFRNY